LIPLKDNIPTDRFPLVTVALILANVLVFFVLQHAHATDTQAVKYAAIPYELKHPGKHCEFVGAQTPESPNGVACQGFHGFRGHVPKQPSTWLTALFSMFMHGGILHIAGNMLFLWIFGNNVEDSMGRLRFIVFYLLGGLAALGLQVLVSSGDSQVVPTLGASGAIAAVLGGYILLYPRARVLTVIFIVFFFTLVELPALLVLGLWFLEQVLFGSANLTNPTGGGGGVAYFAHIGGFAFGLALIRLFATRHKSVPPRLPVY
jgi:membrane associated rhomboid family serine protease